MNLLEDSQKIIILKIIEILILSLVLGITIHKYYFTEESVCTCPNNETNIEEQPAPIESTEPIEEISMVEPINYKVDIKGAVVTPGVYELSSNSIVNDVINLAGGLKSNASTKYINLSKKITNEMVIYIYTNYEISIMNNPPAESCISTSQDITNCKNCSTVTPSPDKEVISSSESTKKVSINTGTKEELMSLTGIGESKAQAIIEYREKNGSFKNLEDITNVSGIGKEAFEKIKNDIEL